MAEPADGDGGPGGDVLILLSNPIGDVVLSTGAADAIFRRHPGARFTVVGSPLTVPLFRGRNDVEALPLRKRKWAGHWFDLWGRLRGRRWAHIYDFRFAGITPFLHGPRSRPARPDHPVRHKVAEAASILGLQDDPPAPVLWPDAEAEAALPEAARDGAQILALGPGASRIGKTWPADRFAALAAGLTAPGGPLDGASVAVIGGPMDRPAAEVIGAALPTGRLIDLTSSDLPVTAALLKRSRLFVGNDSGMTHLAAAAGAPTLALFGPTDERRYAPWGPRAAFVRAEGSAALAVQNTRTVSRAESQLADLDVATAHRAAADLIGRTA